MYRMFQKDDEGFTLVELMVVVLIIGILVAIAIPVFNTARANAQRRSCQSNMRTVEGAYQTWYANSPGNATVAAGLTNWAGLMAVADADDATQTFVPQYVKAIPECPGEGTYSATFPNNGLNVAVTCSVAAHNP